jgi:hypothetical protein
MENHNCMGGSESEKEDTSSLPDYEAYDSGLCKRRKVDRELQVGSSKRAKSVIVLVRDWDSKESPSEESNCLGPYLQKDSK